MGLSSRRNQGRKKRVTSEGGRPVPTLTWGPGQVGCSVVREGPCLVDEVLGRRDTVSETPVPEFTLEGKR